MPEATQRRPRSGKFDRRKQDAYLEALRTGSRRGAAATSVGITRQYLHWHRTRHPEFAEAESEAEMEANELVEDALFRSAIGGTVVERVYKDGELEREKIAAPNVTAQQVWLYNRWASRGADKRNVAVSGGLTHREESEAERARREAAEMERAADIDPDAIRHFARAAAALGQAGEDSEPQSAFG